MPVQRAAFNKATTAGKALTRGGKVSMKNPRALLKGGVVKFR